MASQVRGLQFNQISYNSAPRDPVFSVPAGSQLSLYKASVINGTGGSMGMGIMRSITDIRLSYRNGTEAGGTTQLFNGFDGSVQSTNAIFGAGNELFIGSQEKFNLIGIVLPVSIAAATTLTYWNGSAYVALSILEDFGVNVGAPYDYITFLAPHDWVRGGSPTSGVDSDKFYIRMVNGTAGSMTKVIIAEMLIFRGSVAPNTALTIASPSEDKAYNLESGEGLIPYFQTIDPNNFIEASYNIAS